MNKLIHLTVPQMYVAAQVGIMRHVASTRAGHKDKRDIGDKDFETRIGYAIAGAAGEMAAASALDLFWSAHVNRFKAADIGERIQVRTRSRHYYDLNIKADDTDDHFYVLVTGEMPDFVVRGWLLAREAKQSRFFKKYGAGPPAWYVPQSELRTLDELTLELALTPCAT